jgi:hypothetical protein
MAVELLLPKAPDALGIASNLKSLLAVSLFDSSIKVAGSDGTYENPPGEVNEYISNPRHPRARA